MSRVWYTALLFLLLPASVVHAHPIPRRNHDRTVVVRLTPTALIVDYQLDVDDWTVVYVDMPAVDDQVDLTTLTTPEQWHDAFTRCYGPILAKYLTATLDGRPLKFECVQRSHEVLDHLRCDFRFQADWQPTRDTAHEITFYEGTYLEESGALRLSLSGETGIAILSRTEPDKALKEKAPSELRSGERDKLRHASARFELKATAAPEVKDTPTEDQPLSPLQKLWQFLTHGSLRSLLDSTEGFWLLMVLAALFGAAHALQPGHGKTLVAAYLVGQRGTIWHALFLGIVTTVTHTGSVIALALALFWFLPEERAGEVQSVLGLIGGLLVVGLGFWLLLRRLSGKADHFHLGGHGHHHHHGHAHDHSHADHFHDEHGHVHAVDATTQRVGWWGLLVLGITGGLVPCWDAILMLAMSVRRLSLAVPLLLAFSAGLAAVLILIGMAVVTVKGFASSRWGEKGFSGRVIHALPLLSAVVVTAIGLWLCYESLHGHETPDAPAAHAQP